ncbi:7102_t:CDS:1 [Diversispora eburnea]|uniref:7102_t:CDS:1 n=1 Tax=Diversispora eburnea TaxID=1213867 RepID=A0A9N8Z5T9_9GLOM|nr:7102_t:CDS:1 [Diversispora eburnea]
MTQAVNSVIDLMRVEDVSYTQNYDLLKSLIIRKYMNSKKIREFGMYFFIEVFNFKYNSRHPDSRVDNRIIRKAATDFWKTQLDSNERLLYTQYANRLKSENERINFRRNDLSSIMIDGTPPLGGGHSDENGSEPESDFRNPLIDGSNFE